MFLVKDFFLKEYNIFLRFAKANFHSFGKYCLEPVPILNKSKCTYIYIYICSIYIYSYIVYRYFHVYLYIYIHVFYTKRIAGFLQKISSFQGPFFCFSVSCLPSRMVGCVLAWISRSSRCQTPVGDGRMVGDGQSYEK